MRQIVNGLGALTKLSGLGLGAYHDSAVQGTDLLAARLHQAIRNCGGRTSIILAGYSQGAQVTADVFQRDLSPSERSKVSAVVLFGDPYFNGGDRAVDRGSFSGRRDGVLGKRPKFGSGSTLVLSYCHSHDPICQGFFFRVGPTRTPDPGALTTRQHMNYTCCQEPQEAAKLIAAHIRGATGPPVPTLPDKWPTKRNDGPPAFFEYLGASFIPPDWSSCDPDYCIAGSGDTVYVFSMRDGIDQIGTVPIDIPDPRAGLASLGIPNQDINQLLAP